MKKASNLRQLYSGLKESWAKENHDLPMIRDYLMPELGAFQGTSKVADPSKRAKKILYAKAQVCNNTLASGFHSGMTNPRQKWFKWKPQNRTKLEQEGVRVWFDEVEEVMYQALSKSNFYPTMHSAYLELGGFGFFDILSEPDTENIFNFYHLPVGSFFWSLNEKLEVDCCCWEKTYSPKQLEDKFGIDNFSPELRLKYNDIKQRFKSNIKILHFCMPRKDSKGIYGVRKTQMPFAHYVVEKEAPTCNENKDVLLHEGGYNEFPHFCAKWLQYGDSIYSPEFPGRNALPDILQLQKSVRMSLILQDKMANPPMLTTDNNSLDTRPNAMNPINPNFANVVKPLQQVDPNALVSIESWIRTVTVPIIQEFFFTDVFRMFTADSTEGVISATETIERRQEKMLLMGPVIDRYMYSLDNLLNRIFNMLYRAGKIPDPPKALQDEDVLEIEYISPLAQVQKGAERAAIQATTTFVANLAQVKEDVLDNLDLDSAVTRYATATGVPATVIRSFESVGKIRKAKLEKLEAQKQMEMQQAALQGGEMASNISTEGNTLSGQVAKQMGIGE